MFLIFKLLAARSCYKCILFINCLFYIINISISDVSSHLELITVFRDGKKRGDTVSVLLAPRPPAKRDCFCLTKTWKESRARVLSHVLQPFLIIIFRMGMPWDETGYFSPSTKYPRNLSFPPTSLVNLYCGSKLPKKESGDWRTKLLIVRPEVHAVLKRYSTLYVKVLSFFHLWFYLYKLDIGTYTSLYIISFYWFEIKTLVCCHGFHLFNFSIKLSRDTFFFCFRQKCILFLRQPVVWNESWVMRSILSLKWTWVPLQVQDWLNFTLRFTETTYFYDYYYYYWCR